MGKIIQILHIPSSKYEIFDVERVRNSFGRYKNTVNGLRTLTFKGVCLKLLRKIKFLTFISYLQILTTCT